MSAINRPTANASGYLHERVADSIRSLIENGTLLARERVPSLRSTARRCGVSLSTAMRAYEILEDDGWITAREKSGFYVAVDTARRLEHPAEGRPSGRPERLDLRGLATSLLADGGQADDIIALSLALPPDDLLPAKSLQRAMQRAQRDNPAAALHYAFPPGLEALRRQIATRVNQSGAQACPDDVLITTGCIEALHAGLASVAQPGDTIAVESPTFFEVLNLIEALGMQALELPTDPQQGADPTALEAAFSGGQVQAALLVPSFNNPLGSCMPNSHRLRVATLAARYRIPVIEDDIYGDLHFSPQRPPTVRAFDGDGWILTAASFSKTIAPGYRIGWLLPGRFREQAIFQLHATTLAASTPVQMGIAEYLNRGAYSRHLKRVRSIYRERTRRLRRAIAEHFPGGTRVSDPAGGFVLWVELPAGVSGTTVYWRALAEGIRVAPGKLFSNSPAYDGYLRLACGTAWSGALDEAIKRLGTIVAAETA